MIKHVGLDRLTPFYLTLSPFLQRHSENVALYSEILATAAWEAGVYRCDPGFTKLLLENIRRCACWHDIGKAEISNSLWELRRPLSKGEYALVKTHPVLGAAAIVGKIELFGQSAEDPVIELAKNCCLYHHERWDGAGYPFGIAGTDVPIEGRITAIADAYDSMTAGRPYSRPKGVGAALKELLRCSGTQFDPELVPIFVSAMRELHAWEPDSLEA